MLNTLKAIATSRTNQALTGLAVVAGVIVGTSGLAGAVDYDPTVDLTALATNAVSKMGPIVVALAGAVVGLSILAWGLTAVFRMIKSGGKRL